MKKATYNSCKIKSRHIVTVITVHLSIDAYNSEAIN